MPRAGCDGINTYFDVLHFIFYCRETGLNTRRNKLIGRCRSHMMIFATAMIIIANSFKKIQIALLNMASGLGHIGLILSLVIFKPYLSFWIWPLDVRHRRWIVVGWMICP